VRGERVSRGDAWGEPGTRPTGCKIDWEAGGGEGEGLGTVEDVTLTTNGYVVTVRSVAALCYSCYFISSLRDGYVMPASHSKGVTAAALLSR
jgi:hypothetical protein